MSTLSVSTVCERTGLALMPSESRVIYRVAKTRYGPLNPLLRSGSSPEDWSRWDTPGRTIYGGSTPSGAFAEVLGYIDPEPPAIAMADLFDDVSDSDADSLAEQIACELPAAGAMAYKSIPQGWRQERSLYELTLPPGGWFIDVLAPESIAVLNAECRELLDAHAVARLTMSELTGSSSAARAITTGIATHIRSRVVLFDGSLPHGIVYDSKWGQGLTNWAAWLRRADDGTGIDPIGTQSIESIGRHSEDLRKAADLHGLRIY